MINKLKFLEGKVKEYIKFNIIGISNFTISQVFYITLFKIFKLNYIIAYTITSILSILASYLLLKVTIIRLKNFPYQF